PTPLLSTLSLHDALPIYRRELRRDSFRDRGDVRRLVEDGLHHRAGHRLGVERQLAAERFVEHDPEREDVRARVERLAEGLLRRQDRKSTRLNSSHVATSY